MSRLIFFGLLLLSIVFYWQQPATQTTIAPLEYRNASDLYYQGEIQEAQNLWIHHLQVNPLDISSRRDLAQSYVETSHVEEALREYEIIAEQLPDDPKSQLDLGWLLLSMNDMDASEKAFQKAFSLSEYTDWLAAFGLGLATNQLSYLQKAVELNPQVGLIYYHIGNHHNITNPSEAVSAYQRALRLDGNISQALLPLGVNLMLTQDFTRAYQTFERALRVNPQSEAGEQLSMLKQSHPHIEEELTQAREEVRQISPPPTIQPIVDDQSPIVRVGLMERAQEIQVRSNNPGVLIGENTSIDISRGDQLTFLDKDGQLHVKINGNDQGIFEHSLILTLQEFGHSITIYDIDFGQGYFWAGREDRHYRGSLEIIPQVSGLTGVNVVNLEEYLYGVLPAEMPAWWPQEALKAQAIAARSYTLANMGRFAHRGFDLTGSVRSAAYGGIKAETTRTNQALEETRGLVLTYEDKPINAVYSANTGGYTETSAMVWQWGRPYLQAKADLLTDRDEYLAPADLKDWLINRPPSYSNESPFASASSYRWVQEVTTEQLARRHPELGQIHRLEIKGRGGSGRIEGVYIHGSKGDRLVTGDTMRSHLGGLRSNLFTILPQLNENGQVVSFLFFGAGWGHGVGMCQTGAAGMANQGYTHEEILLHFYPETILQSIPLKD